MKLVEGRLALHDAQNTACSDIAAEEDDFMSFVEQNGVAFEIAFLQNFANGYIQESRGDNDRRLRALELERQAAETSVTELEATLET